jgi:tRNA A-37 threonylcarbamoyl transferase component Bud32
MICPQCQADNRADSRFCHKCATPLQIDKDHPIDQTLTLEYPPTGLARGTLFAGRYEVIEELGRGGMGRVYKVYDQKIKEVVALKVIHPEISVNEKAVDRFRNELKFARKIGHRHVCRMFDLGEVDRTFYITMEYVEGENLKSFIRRSGQLAPRKAISLGKQVCEGLAEAHRMGIIHRDLKPQNIMIDREGNARIMDFGIARFTEGEGLTGSGVMVGTPEYMSPEQTETLEVDKRADLYALGVILYEMVTGRVPFVGETPFAVLIKHKQEPPQNPQESNPLVSEALTRIILRCLAKDRGVRYQSAEELYGDLTAAEADLPRAEKAPKTRILRRGKRSLKPWIWVGLGAVGIMTLASVWYLYSRRGPVRVLVDEAGRTRRTELVKPPQPPPAAEFRAEESPGHRTEVPKSVFSLLSPEALRKLSEKEVQEILNFDKQMAAIKGVIPQGAVFDETWTSAYQKVREGDRLHKEGRVEEAQKSKKEGQDEMQKLLTLVAQRDKALEAKSLLTEVKSGLKSGPGIENNVLYRVAGRREQDADRAFADSDFSGSQTLCSVLTEVYRLSGKCSNAGVCLEELASLVASMRGAAESPASGTMDPWLRGKARDYEEKAQRALAQADYEGAAEQYIQAAFLYQKMIDQGR